MKARHLLLGAFVLLAGLSFAQTAPESDKTFFFAQTAPPPPENAVWISNGPAKGEFLFVEGMDHKVVTGAPYSATESTESTQVLADGNRIVHKQSGLVARDGQGRTRREETMGAMGPVQVEGAKMVMIHDPVAKAMYMLNPDKQTANVMKNSGGPPNMRMMEMHRKMAGALVEHRAESGSVKTESLGKQEIEGVVAEGTRVTRTIPAGAIGNEQPIQITVETWTSPDLQAVVLQKRSDPRFGETVFRLTNINRSEPDPALFQVPANFKVEQHTMRMKVEAPPAPAASK